MGAWTRSKVVQTSKLPQKEGWPERPLFHLPFAVDQLPSLKSQTEP